MAEEATIADKLGNNVLVDCTNCKLDYIVGSPPIYRKPRACPHCGKTWAWVEKGGKVYIETIPWAR